MKKNGNVVKEIKNVILNLIQDLQRLSLINNMRGRCPAGRPLKYGMTALFDSPSPRCWRTRPLPQGARGTARGFTLIELLVVVLIIGVLAAVAVPQYQIAVMKARVKRNLPIIRSILKADEAYYLANGKYTCDLDNLDIDLEYVAKEDKGTYYTCEGDTLWRYYLNTQQDRVYFVGDRAWYSIPETLTVDVYANGKMLCYGEGENASFGDKVCKSMGTQIEEGNTYLLN